jgi:hypothetical protein
MYGYIFEKGAPSTGVGWLGAEIGGSLIHPFSVTHHPTPPLPPLLSRREREECTLSLYAPSPSFSFTYIHLYKTNYMFVLFKVKYMQRERGGEGSKRVRERKKLEPIAEA